MRYGGLDMSSEIEVVAVVPSSYFITPLLHGSYPCCSDRDRFLDTIILFCPVALSLMQFSHHLDRINPPYCLSESLRYVSVLSHYLVLAIRSYCSVIKFPGF